MTESIIAIGIAVIILVGAIYLIIKKEIKKYEDKPTTADTPLPTPPAPPPGEEPS